ncbi:hypothetical protein [Shinella pollutisoli]|uniref:Uncharacterized protein n=1 Tax=Shinella pollutisoli TaxID=2250594 RepID=A0ABV7DL23_9HYPH|nr:hypothetical protein [Shinella pollutisoli]
MSTTAGNGASPTRLNWRLVSLVLVAAGLALVIGANAHLVRVAFESQPDCVPHLKAGTLGAAKPAC